MVVGGYLKGAGMLKDLGKLLAELGRPRPAVPRLRRHRARQCALHQRHLLRRAHRVRAGTRRRAQPPRQALPARARHRNTVEKLLTDGQVQASKFLMLSGKTKSLSMYLSLVIIFSPVRCGECRAVTGAVA